MSYYSGWQLSADQHFMNRVGFCAETEGLGWEWGIEHRMSVAAAPGFAAAYESAILAGVPDPGLNPAVISDQQILSAVQDVAEDQGLAVKSERVHVEPPKALAAP